MRILVESLKRVEKKTLTIDEFNYIVGEEEKTEPEQSEE